MAKKKLVEQEHDGMALVEDDGYITVDTSQWSDSASGYDMGHDWINFAYDNPCTIEYKFNERGLLNEMQEYIDSTYTQHYAKNKFQATEFIFDSGHAQGFCIGNILKYAQRYGKKGTMEESRRDLQKVIHYAIMALHAHDTDQ